MERAVDPFVLLSLLIVGVIAGIIGAIVGGRRASQPAAAPAAGAAVDPPSAMGTAAEAAFLAIFGGFVARIFIAGLLTAAGDAAGARLAIGWGFFLIPGIIDTLPSLAGAQPLTHPTVLLTLGTVVGAWTGFMAGLYRIYDWKGLGVLQLLGDVIWGLAGSTTAALVALINVFFGDHASDDRSGAHRYTSGFRLLHGYAFTQGNVMSNLSDPRGEPLYKHERLHVFQNRLFGPIFMLTYLGWMALMIIPSAIASIAKKSALPIQGWCYRSNPWEVWAYYVQRKASNEPEETFFRGGGEWAPHVFKERTATIMAVPFFLLALPLMVVIVIAAW